ncbi:hypothetical protein LVD17_26530 [Fulvivirga ulvae]|uniref:glycosyltransferase family 2 protein n=1 Tax=Fulvivirga ulvae TaxID=2904245 RepID=UPI001F40CC9B|nr:glycosyltransferase family 2 protein [Fulvivirga ulvae]UII31850.1 hypothetical protein LVD17_26530 [Fulvivirga ulvae]
MFKLDILIPWKNRKELSRCLKENGAFFEEEDVKANFIIINCGGDRQQVSDLVNEADISFPIRIVHFEYPGFNKSLALNLGILNSTEATIMVLDTDVIFQDLDIEQLKTIIDRDAFATIAKVLEEKPEPEEFPEAAELLEIGQFIEFKAANGNKALVEMNRQGVLDKSRSGPGIIITTKRALTEVGGYNSELEGWGWEDLDLITRLQLKQGMERVALGTVLHMTHNDDVRYITPEFNFKKQNEQRNFQICLINYRLGIVEGSLEEDKKYIDLIEEEHFNDRK